MLSWVRYVMTCSVDGCSKPVRCKKLCVNHYALHLRNGFSIEELSSNRVSNRVIEICGVEDCTNLVKCKKLCSSHYGQQLRTGRSIQELTTRKFIRGALCSVDKCDRVQYSNGLCNLHWRRVRDFGDVGEAELMRIRRLTNDGEPLICILDSCSEPVVCNELCQKHYDKVRSHERRTLLGALSTEENYLRLSYEEILLSDPCSYCGSKSQTIDHVVPVSRGGGLDWTNLTGSCKSCNSRKSTFSLLAFMLRRL